MEDDKGIVMSEVFVKLKEDLRVARIAKDVFRADTLRTLIGDIENAVSQVGARPVEDIVQGKLKSFSQNSSDFIVKLRSAVVVNELLILDKFREIEIYESYRVVVEMVSIDVIRGDIIAAFGSSITAKQRGAVMGLVKSKYAGRFNGAEVNSLVSGMIA